MSLCLPVKRVLVAKRKKPVPTFLYHTKEHSSEFSDKENGWWGRPLLSKILGQTDPVPTKRRFSIDIRS